jgi:gluconolactonase
VVVKAQLEHPVLVDGELELVVTGARWSEGPVWIPATSRLRWSDIPTSRVLEWWPGLTAPSVYRDDAEFTNGRTLDVDGAIIECSHGHRAIERDDAGELSTVVDTYHGARLNSPNDVIVAADGTVLFTDPPYGIVQADEGHPGEREYGDNAVFRFDRHTGLLEPAVLDMEEPNGLALSPDERVLYVADTSSVFRRDGTGHAHIRAYDVLPGFRCKNGRVFAVPGGLPDGLRVDREGRIWTSAGTGVEVYTPEGRLLLRVEVPEKVGNLCFGGASGTELFIAATTSIYRLRTTTTDATKGR